MSAIEVDDLHVTYTPRHRTPVEAVRGVSFEVREGEVFGLLGANGAGKTSTLEVCEGFRPPTSGAVSVLGLTPHVKETALELRRQVGIVLQEIAVEPYLTVREAITRNAGYYEHPRDVDDVLETVGLGEKRDARINTLSGGQQRRLDLGLGIVGRPRLLFLDEPTTGFDPSARRGAWDVIRALRDEGTTIVLTTHYLDEAEALADRVCVIGGGRVLAEGSPRELGGRGDAPARIRFALSGAPTAGLPTVANDEVSYDGDEVTLRAADPTRTLHALTSWALDNDRQLERLTVERASLEDVYLDLTRGSS
ncbi:MAG: type transport system ATP-binding protein [Actinomycetota bacterium]|nr:type transport system ATP-binding protein [Actinomycetota bacterium]